MIIFFGWGRKSLRQQLAPDQVLVLQYRYFHLFWVFRVAWGLRYSLATLSPQYGWAVRPLTESEIAYRDPSTLLDLHWWWRWGLLVGLVLVLVVTMVASLY